MTMTQGYKDDDYDKFKDNDKMKENYSQADVLWWEYKASDRQWQ